MVKIDNNAKKYIFLALGLAAAGVAGWLIYRKIKGANMKIFGDTDYNGAVGRLQQANAAAKEIETSATITKQKAQQLADQIKNAWGVANDDEEAIYSAIQQINNMSDWLLLVSAYGVRSTLLGSYDLPADLQRGLNEKEMATLVHLLDNKGINAFTKID